MILRLASRLLPAPLLRFVGQLQYRVPVLGPWIRKAAARVATGEGVIRRGVGAGLRFRGDGAVAGYMLGTTEPALQDALARTIRRGAVVYDLGANVGFYTLLAAHLTGPEGHVYAFEPFPHSAEAVRHNVRLNNFEHVTILEMAVSDRPRTGWLETDTGPNTFKLGPEQGRPGQAVSVTAIDAFLADGAARPPDVIKMDVEGEEKEALVGMKETLRRHRPTVLCEVHYAVTNFEDFVARELAPLGYTVASLTGDALPAGDERYHVVLAPARAPGSS